jgi:hypothetical protein
MKRALEQVGRASLKGHALFAGSLLACGASLLLSACRPLPVECYGGDETCEEPPDLPPGVQSCDLHSFEGSPTGQCIPYVDAGWHTSLVKMAHLPKSQLRCPPSAPFAGFTGVEIPENGSEPRNVIGCSVNPLATCSSLSFACVPFEEDYSACVNQADNRDCQYGYYKVKTTVEEDGVGGQITVCCPLPEDAG